MLNPWKVLGVHRKSSDEEIQEAFHKIARENHPDSGRGSAEVFCTAARSYQLLKTKKARTEYIALTALHGTHCVKCSGKGVVTSARSLTEKSYIACAICDGSGFIIKTKGVKDVAIKC